MNDVNINKLDILKGSRSVLIILGILQILFGIIALGSPWLFTVAITEVIAVLFMITGVVQFIQVLHSHAIDKKKAFGGIIIALLYLIAGFFMIKNPAAAVVTLTAIIGWFFIVKGIIILLNALHSKTSKTWQIINAAITLILGIMIVGEIPGDAPWILGILVGVNLVITGWTSVMFGMSIPKN